MRPHTGPLAELGLLEAAFASSPLGNALLGADGRILRINPAACEIVGRPEAELLGRVLAELIHPDDCGLYGGGMAWLAGGAPGATHAERRIVTGTGESVWVLFSVAAARRPDGDVHLYVVQLQDISARRRAQRQLQEAEAEARAQRDHATAIIGAMSEGYALTLDGEIVAVNDALCELTGFNAEELVGSYPPYPFVPPEQRIAGHQLRACIRRERGGQNQLVLMRADGERFEAEMTSRPARVRDGRRVAYVNTIRDVSVQRRQQRELERLASTDTLTQLANRRVLQEALSREAGRRQTDTRKLALVLLDIDHFKEINDAHGHPAGDQVLIEVARRLQGTVRAGEVLARVGGEEFAWLLAASNVDEALAAADRARAVIAAEPIEFAATLTLSAGVALASTPTDGDTLYRLADRALYEAKQAGRDRTCAQVERPEGGALLRAV
ncbi:MAG: diguanylate cyclase [Solirubrobacteraceae bacterium]